eukprot:344759_1
MSSVEEVKHESLLNDTPQVTQLVSTSDTQVLNRVVEILKEYESINHYNTDEYQIEQFIVEYMRNIQYDDLINDYHYILKEYSQRFEIMNASIKNQVACEIATCKSYQRNCRDLSSYHSEEKKHHEIETCFYTDVLDNMHTFLVHSYDTGFRLKEKDKMNQSSLKSFFRSKRSDLIKVRGRDTIMHNKFCSKLDGSATAGLISKVAESNDNDTVDDESANIEMEKYSISSNEDIKYEPYSEIPDTETISVGQYSFGQRLYYWEYYKNKNEKDPFNPGYKYCDWYINKKYDTFKMEILNKIDINKFNHTRYKATQLLKHSKSLKQIQSREISAYEIKMKQTLSYDYLMSVIFYTDYTELSSNFSSTFRKISSETDESMKKRNSYYCNWSRLLVTTVHAFGSRLNCPYGKSERIKALYHGVSFMYFNAFAARFCSPTSTTPHFEVAAMFANQDEDGLVLTLNNCPDDYPFYFNASLVSRFGVEDERLFIAGSGDGSTNAGILRFLSVRNLNSGDDYSTAIQALSLFDVIVSAKTIPQERHYDRLHQLYQVIRDLIDGKGNYPQYIVEIFKRFTNSKKFIQINLHDVHRYASAFSDIFVDDFDVESLFQFDKICKIFINCQEIQCDMSHQGQISISYFSRLTNQLIKMDKSISNSLKKIRLINITHSVVINTAAFLNHLKRQNHRLNWYCSHRVSELIFTKTKSQLILSSNEFILAKKNINPLEMSLLGNDINAYEESQEIDERKIVHELIAADDSAWFVSDSLALLLHNLCYYIFAITITLETKHYDANVILLWMTRCSLLLCAFETILIIFQTCVFAGKIKCVHLLTTIPTVQILLDYLVNIPMMIIQMYYLYNVLRDYDIYIIAISECIAVIAYLFYTLYKIMIIFCHHHPAFKYYANWEIRKYWGKVIQWQFINWIYCVPAVMIGFGVAFFHRDEDFQLSLVVIMIGSYLFIISGIAGIAAEINAMDCIRSSGRACCVCHCCTSVGLDLDLISVYEQRVSNIDGTGSIDSNSYIVPEDNISNIDTGVSIDLDLYSDVSYGSLSKIESGEDESSDTIRLFLLHMI